MPTEKQVEQAICCPEGCLRPEDCWSGAEVAVRNGAAKAIMDLFKPRIVSVERRPFVIKED